MADEKQPEPEYVSYADRVAQMREDEKKDLFKKQVPVQKFKQSEDEEVLAQALARLFQNDDFKTYLAFENQEFAALVANAFTQPTADVFPTLSFGEQMAFNKGRHHQMKTFSKRRTQILNVYLNRLDQQIKVQQEE